MQNMYRTTGSITQFNPVSLRHLKQTDMSQITFRLFQYTDNSFFGKRTRNRYKIEYCPALNIRYATERTERGQQPVYVLFFG